MSSEIIDQFFSGIPDGWRRVAVGEVLMEVSEPIQMRDSDLYNLVSVRRRNGGVFLREQLFGRQILTKDLQRVIPGSFIVARRQIIHGASAIASREFEGAAVSSSYSLFIGRENCNTRFFSWLARHPLMYAYFVDASQGIVVEKMNFDVERWLSYPINLPPLPEQLRIVKILDNTDENIWSAERLIAKLEMVRRGLLGDLLTRGIDEHGCLRGNQSYFKDSRVGKIPASWGVSKLNDLSYGHGEYGSLAAALPFSPDMPRYVRITDIAADGSLRKDSRASISEPNSRSYMLREGDLCFARTGATVGKAHLYSSQDGPCAFAGYLIRYRINPTLVNPDFVWLWTQGPMYEKWVHGILQQGAQPNINAQSYGRHELPLPPRAEQDAIVRKAQSLSNLITTEKHQLDEFRQLRQGLMNDLITGRVRVGGLA